MAKRQSDGNILHFNGTRLRIFGSGNLNQSLKSVQNVRGYDLVSLPVVPTTNREAFVLADFREQKAQLRFGTTEIGETFTISKIVIYNKPVATGYPG